MVLNPSETWPSCTLAIAGLGVKVHCNVAPAVQYVAESACLFPLDRPAQFTLKVKIRTEARQPVDLERAAHFDCSRLVFSAPGCHGLIDAAQGVGEVELDSPRPAADLDYLVRVVYALLADQAGGFLFHSAAVAQAGKAYVFFGLSGSGKTTVARLSTNGRVLNDDLVVLRPDSSGWRVYPTPFWNPTQVRPTAEDAPLAGLYRLVQAKRVFLETMSAGQALGEFIASLPVVNLDAQRSPQLMVRALQLLQAIPAYRLHFLPDASFWPVVLAGAPA